MGSEDPCLQAFEEYRTQRDRREGHMPQPRLVADRGEAVGMADRLTPPLSAYAETLERDAGRHDRSGPTGGNITPRPPFVLVRASNMKFAEPEYAIAGLVEVEILGMIFGKPGSGKSFIALDMACCVAAGVPYHGRDVLQGAVVYIAGEGHNGLKRRQMAWEKYYGVRLDSAPLYFSQRSTNLTDGTAADDVIAAIEGVAQIEGVPPRLVIVDTVARNFGGGDENSTKDMTAFVAGVDGIKHRFPGCSVLLVHHTGHGDGDRARGSSVLLGALDAEYRAEMEDKVFTLTCTKMKESAEPAPLAFEAHTIEIGRTAKGEAVTSLAFEEIAAPAKRTGRGHMSPANRLALDTFLSAKREAGVGDDLAAGVHVDEWRKAFYAASTADNADAKKVSFQRARKALVEAGHLAVTDQVYRLARIPGGNA
jgi:hypothetical protein